MLHDGLGESAFVVRRGMNSLLSGCSECSCAHDEGQAACYGQESVDAKKGVVAEQWRLALVTRNTGNEGGVSTMQISGVYKWSRGRLVD